MLDLKFVRENPEVVKQNIRNKFQDEKLPLVDEFKYLRNTVFHFIFSCGNTVDTQTGNDRINCDHTAQYS